MTKSNSNSRFDSPDEWVYETALKIERFGYTGVAVNTGSCSTPGCDGHKIDGPTWVYSIGMIEHGLSELVIVGPDHTAGGSLLAAAFDLQHLGFELPFGRESCIGLGGRVVTTLPVPDQCWIETDLVAMWHNYYEVVGLPDLDVHPQPIRQLVIADGKGSFPWEDQCDAGWRIAQPILEDNFSAWTRQTRAVRRRAQRAARRRHRRR